MNVNIFDLNLFLVEYYITNLGCRDDMKKRQTEKVPVLPPNLSVIKIIM